MPLTVIEDKKQIQVVHKKLERKLVLQSSKHGKINIGYPGGNETIVGYWFAKQKLWWALKKGSWGYWNSFGMRTNENEPEWNSRHSHNITCEFNPPTSGNRWTKASCFVSDDDGRIYLAHTGKIGGGRKGVGKSAFEGNYSGSKQWQNVVGSAGQKRVIIISELDDKSLISNLEFFVREVKKIKELAIKRKLHKKPKFLYKSFVGEFEGPRVPYTLSQTIHANVFHGTIVRSLKKLAQKMNFNTFHNRPTDLYLENKSGKTAMFEIKTDVTSNSKYKAIGQLIYNSKRKGAGKPVLVAVFPSNIDSEFKRILNDLKIKLITYKLKDEELVFDGRINRILLDLT